jgi:hypothetical protein
LAVFASALSPATAASPIDNANINFQKDVQSDYDMVSDFVNGQLARSFGFYSGLGWQVNPTVLDLLNGPRIEVGVGVGADLMKLGNVDSLRFKALESGGNIDLPKIMPFPFPVWHLKGGLLKGVDFGLRGGSIPRLRLNEGQFSYVSKNLGMELRCRAIERKDLPTVTVCASWDKLQGDCYANTNVDQKSQYLDGGILYDVTILGKAVYYTSWNVHSFGVKVLVGKYFGVIYPFAGFGFQRNAGVVHSQLNVKVHESVTDGVLTPQQDVELNYYNDRRPKVVENKVLCGVELGGPFFWTILFETNGRDTAFSTGFRLQI